MNLRISLFCMIAIGCLGMCSVSSTAQGTDESTVYKSLQGDGSPQITTDGIANWHRAIREMESQGYAIEPDSAFDGYEIPNTLMPAHLYEARLGYVPIDFKATPFENHLVGVLAGAEEKDGRIHQMLYVFEIPGLGIVALNENSFGTNPSFTRFEQAAPSGNIMIADTEGTLMAFKSRDGRRGRTFADVVIKRERHLRLMVLRALAPGSRELSAFTDLATDLN